MDADAVFTPDDDLKKEFPGNLDAVVDAVGKQAIINTALGLIKLGGSVCVYGVVSESSMNIEKDKGPYNFNLFVHQWPTRHRERAAMEPLCEWIRAGKLNADEYITHKFKVEDISQALDEVKNGNVIKALLRY
jgi:threonine dehydrogenase-like Zn-dependent dehydrogenase